MESSMAPRRRAYIHRLTSGPELPPLTTGFHLGHRDVQLALEDLQGLEVDAAVVLLHDASDPLEEVYL
ncbi:hypothetical protein CTA1_464 [Colletotrichum tanaceti]|uniref:Uncharacterized protein n=1 Tax=Colletotrichum tanaceti TaxID=1306861 RepID=A0A4V6DGV0_9PEZI|nr:hypothetical protein CTA1_464 [Colletotrichum tanaceti]